MIEKMPDLICPICGTEMNLLKEEKFSDIYECKECGLVLDMRIDYVSSPLVKKIKNIEHTCEDCIYFDEDYFCKLKQIEVAPTKVACELFKDEEVDGE